MSADTERLRELHAAATPGPWKSMSAGNVPLGDGRLVGQSRLDPVPRPFEPRWVGWANQAHQFETYMTDADANLVATLRNEAPALLDELDRLRRLEAADTAWPLPDVLQRLADATEHGLTAHDCDHHGHESDRAAIAAARRIIAECRAAKEGDRG